VQEEGEEGTKNKHLSFPVLPVAAEKLHTQIPQSKQKVGLRWQFWPFEDRMCCIPDYCSRVEADAYCQKLNDLLQFFDHPCT
jgi:hypothetical protein